MQRQKRKTLISFFLILIFLFSSFENLIAQGPPPPPPPQPAISDKIRDTKHNLSVTGPGAVKAAIEDRICFFCHTPHNARTDVPYLWNRSDPADNYIPYQSSTLYASVGQPTGASKLCLSCHDGTIALGALVSEPQEILFSGGIRFIQEGPAKIGTDLSDDHPVSFVYDNSLATANGELVFPSGLPLEIKLDVNGELQCTSCHDPHNNRNGQFLIMQNIFSNLCTSCHDLTLWTTSTHSTSNAVWNGIGPDPWPWTEFTTVSENACENCHKPHTAGRHERLLNYFFEEDNCLVCHNGNVASTDIESELTKLYRHASQDYTGIHDAAEDFSAAVQNHVECVDCHNPHRSNHISSSVAPAISGMNEGVSGISTSGAFIRPASNLYEICYKCHADNNVISTIRIDRQLQQLNTRLEFDPSNPSYHPVEAIGSNANVPSLLPPYTSSSIIFCTDCHNNNDTLAPSGPHGSVYEFLLEENYTTQDFTQENATNYALCYKCHDRNSILNDISFSLHNKHIIAENTPCSACHDAHGISNTQGNSLNNTHLINFDITIVQPDSQSRLRFEDTGIFSGRCFLNCHGKSHEPEIYP